MRRLDTIKALLLNVAAVGAAQPATAAILYQATLTPVNGMVSFDSSLLGPSVTTTGSTWIGISGGRIRGADWSIFGEFAKYWWEEHYDAFGNPEPYLNGNEYFYWNGCAVTDATPSCQSGPSFRSQLHNNTVRVDFIAPKSYNNCFPFNGIYDVDCAVIMNLQGANFYVEASGIDDVTLTIQDTRISGAIPEPASWAMLIAGFGLTGAVMRRIRRTAKPQASG